jgi:hypothetical protein
MSLAQYIIVLAHLPVFITAGFAARVYQRLGKELRTFAWLLFLSGIIQVISLVCWFNKINNFPLLHLYTPLSFISMAAFYVQVLQGFIKPRVIWGVAIAFTCYTLLNSLFVQGIFSFNSYALTVQAVLVVIVTLSAYMLFLQKATKASRGQLMKSFHWINSGLFIYYSSSLLIFNLGGLFARYFSPEMIRYIWVVHDFFSVIMYTCFFIGLCKQTRN